MSPYKIKNVMRLKVLLFTYPREALLTSRTSVNVFYIVLILIAVENGLTNCQIDAPDY